MEMQKHGFALTEKEERTMTDKGKVIKGLKCCCGTGMCFHGCPYYGASKKITECTSQLALEALELLKEQEAVEPVPPEDEFSLYRCGKCYHQLFRCVDKYCSRCGQAVKWE